MNWNECDVKRSWPNLRPFLRANHEKRGSGLVSRHSVEMGTSRMQIESIAALSNPLNAELNPICHLLALLGGATIVDVSRLRANR
jgi:hypothetical protein